MQRQKPRAVLTTITALVLCLAGSVRAHSQDETPQAAGAADLVARMRSRCESVAKRIYHLDVHEKCVWCDVPTATLTEAFGPESPDVSGWIVVETGSAHAEVARVPREQVKSLWVCEPKSWAEDESGASLSFSTNGNWGLSIPSEEVSFFRSLAMDRLEFLASDDLIPNTVVDQSREIVGAVSDRALFQGVPCTTWTEIWDSARAPSESLALAAIFLDKRNDAQPEVVLEFKAKERVALLSCHYGRRMRTFDVAVFEGDSAMYFANLLVVRTEPLTESERRIKTRPLIDGVHKQILRRIIYCALEARLEETEPEPKKSDRKRGSGSDEKPSQG